MKRLAFLLSVVLVLSMLLTSCEYVDFVLDLFEGEPETAEELWERIDEEMDELDSYTATIEATLNYEFLNRRVMGDLKSTVTEIGDPGDDDYYSYLYNSVEIYVGGSLTTEAEGTVVYQDGKMYISNTSGDASNRLVSEISAEEFLDYISGEIDILELPMDNATDKEMKHRGDDKWELTFSISDEDDLTSILEDLTFDEKSLGISITEISFEIIADEDYRAEEINVTFYSGDDDVITMSASYGSFNTAEKEEIDESKYNEVDNILVAVTLEEYIEGALDLEELDFTVDISYKIRDTKQQQSYDVYDEYDVVSVKNKNGAFTYSIGSNSGGEKYSIEYAYGTATISGSGIYESTPQSTLEARSFIMNLLDPLGCSVMNVSGIEKYSAEQYKITLNPANITDYRQLIISLGDVYVSHQLYVLVELDGDNVESIEGYVSVTGRQYVYTIEYKVEIGK